MNTLRTPGLQCSPQQRRPAGDRVPQPLGLLGELPSISRKSARLGAQVGSRKLGAQFHQLWLY